jgi:membrane protease YdiL (CAAX protease family)
MHTGGSAPGRTIVPPAIAIGSVFLGFAAMSLAAVTAVPHGMRFGFVVAELALVAPGVAAVAACAVPWRAIVDRWPLDTRTTLLMLAAGSSLWVMSLGLLELQYVLWAPSPEYIERFRRLHEALKPDGPLDALVSVAAIALVPALCEELLMRGIVLPSLMTVVRPGAAISISALIFAAIHWDLYRFVFTLVLGLALGYLRIRTGSLAACVLAHAALNTLTFVVVPFADDPSQALPDPRPLAGLAMLLGGGAVTAVLVRLLPSLTRPGTVPRLGS